MGHSEPEIFSLKILTFLKMTKSPGCGPAPMAPAVTRPWGRVAGNGKVAGNDRVAEDGKAAVNCKVAGE